jgi:GTPase SAR1 family protein
MKGWADEVKSTAPKDIKMAVVGNKIDMLSDNYDEQTDESKY